ncbi:MAG: hypothetical protein ABH986_01230 [archaeon]
MDEKKSNQIEEIVDAIKGKKKPEERKKENLEKNEAGKISGKTGTAEKAFGRTAETGKTHEGTGATGKPVIEKEREEEIEKMIGLLKKDDDELLKKDRLTEKVNKLVEETEKELGQIKFTGIKPEREKKKENALSYLKKLVKKKS